MEQNKLYRLIKTSDKPPEKEGEYWTISNKGKDSGYYTPASQFLESTLYYLEEYTPPTPLELEQLEDKINEWQETGPTLEFTQGWIKKFWRFLKPLISSMLQEKDEQMTKTIDRIKEEVKSVNEYAHSKYRDYSKEISFLKLQVRLKEQRIKELETELTKILKQ